MSIRYDDFISASTSLSSLWENSDDGDSNWDNVMIVESYGTSYLRITKNMTHVASYSRTNNTSGEADHRNEIETDVDEQDDEALIHTPQQTPSRTFLTTYDIIHSPSYQVPVLYLNTKPSTQSLNDLYALLTPPSLKPQLRTGGVMGALSMTDHPVTGLPAYFVHPCRTSEAMGEVTADRGRDVKPVEYLLLWLGLAGAGVGLDVPVALAEAMIRTSTCGGGTLKSDTAL